MINYCHELHSCNSIFYFQCVLGAKTVNHLGLDVRKQILILMKYQNSNNHPILILA